MRKDTMDQYTLQSYFKSLCNSFYIAYEQVKRLEKEEEELEKNNPHEEFENVKNLLTALETEELKKKTEELGLANEEFIMIYMEFCKRQAFWEGRLNKINLEISYLIEKIKDNGFTIIVTRKEEIIVLMYHYRISSGSEYDVINTKEEYLKSFPTGEKMYEEFLSAYCLRDGEKMREVYKKYF